MNTEIFIANELAALLSAPAALLGTCLAAERSKAKLLIFGQLIAFAAALLGSVWALSHTDLAPATAGLNYFPLRMDAISSCLLTGITFIAAIVVTFSDRYLLGDKTRLRFLRFLSMLSSSAALLVVTDSMLVAFICWSSLSLWLWGIMRNQAGSKEESATVLRYHLLSDVALLLSLLLIVGCSGITTFSNLTSADGLLSGEVSFFNANVLLSTGTAASLLMILSFSIKSALFPFHRWLLATLSAPTPLSGLLHAGVVNVSAIMAWRMMPILHEHSYVLLIWGLWSALSAIVGTLSMSAQPDVKRKLVYSTTGQMGFMSLQCAVGAPGAAIFHLLAHGLFKCHMFLQSGSAVTEGLTKRKFGYACNAHSQVERLRSVVFVAAAAIGFCSFYAFCINASWTSFSAIIAAAALLSAVPAFDRIDFGPLSLFWLSTLALALAAGLASSYFEHFLSAGYSVNTWLLPVFLIFSLGLALGLKLSRKSSMAKAVYVHSLNGFYVHELDMRYQAERISN